SALIGSRTAGTAGAGTGTRLSGRIQLPFPSRHGTGEVAVARGRNRTTAAWLRAPRARRQARPGEGVASAAGPVRRRRAARPGRAPHRPRALVFRGRNRG